MPTDVPVSDPDTTNDSIIAVDWANPPPHNNGSPIISYELAMDDGVTGNYVSILGLAVNTLLTQKTIDINIIKGRRHRIKYRARNSVGWGPYSNEALVLAASRPDAPPKPFFHTFESETL